MVRDRKRERSESIVDAEPRKPRRHDRDTTFSRTQERAKEAGGLEDNIDLVSDKKGPVVLPTQAIRWHEPPFFTDTIIVGSGNSL